ncbi:AMP deaminase [Apis cerana cerana]|uniref:AMP deaminase n=1 Tax=Apis cerana cerana TaxID=94128 RepID=A0A2A3E4K4_APICC|nr:AMP deaminase [Apis cerana cerana]
MVLGNENDYMTGYKRNSVTEWLQKTGQAKNDGSESPVFGLEGGTGTGGGTSLRLASHELPNEISAPYEVPQFPIEQIEKKLLIQRQLTVKAIHNWDEHSIEVNATEGYVDGN